MNAEKITVGTTVALIPEKVWDFWTKPEHITGWNFASPDWHCPRAENDLRVGGKMNSRMEAKDGSMGFDFVAVYDEVVPMKKIAYTMEDGRRAITVFSKEGSGTQISTTFDAEGTHPLEMQKNGWQAIMENFKNYAEAQAR